MSELLGSIAAIVASMAVAYVLGAFPMAGWLGRRRGIDIYSAGTGLAGAANVMRSVGRIEGALVLIWDLTKGGLAVLAGWWIGADGAQVLFPVGAVLMGHWVSVFSGFKGGDGLGTLGGCVIALFPVTGIIAVAVAMLVALGGQRMPYPSLLGIVFGYGTLAVLNLTPELNLAEDADMALTVGIGGFAGLVLARAVRGHIRRRDSGDLGGLDDSPGTPEDSR